MLLECPPAPVIENATVVSNDVALGGRTRYTCNDTFGLWGGAPEIDCIGTGQYSDILFACYRKFCYNLTIEVKIIAIEIQGQHQ